jgi:F-type H+-transporting ATPase subunit gamma
MPSVAQLKSRIRSVNSTRQITGAMELVSASKMRRAAERSLATQPYHRHISDLLVNLVNEGMAENHPLFVHRPLKKRLLIVIASDTGLAGAYNANVLKRLLQSLKFDQGRDAVTQILAVGRKTATFVSRLDGVEMIGAYEGLSGESTAGDRLAITETAIRMYRDAEVDAVDIIYTRYQSSINQEIKLWHLLPAGHIPSSVDGSSATRRHYTFEPSREIVFNALINRAIEDQVTQAVFDSAASEHSTRMLAMKSATDNANELSEDLTLAMNKARQAAITQEISEISNGAEAVE